MRKITKKQIGAIHAVKSAHGMDEDTYRSVLDQFNVSTSKDLTFEQARALLSRFYSVKPPAWEGKYTGRGQGLPNDFLTQAQANEIARLQHKLKMTDMQVTAIIHRTIKKRCAVPMLMKYEAQRVLIPLRKIAKEE